MLAWGALDPCPTPCACQSRAQATPHPHQRSPGAAAPPTWGAACVERGAGHAPVRACSHPEGAPAFFIAPLVPRPPRRPETMGACSCLLDCCSRRAPARAAPSHALTATAPSCCPRTHAHIHAAASGSAHHSSERDRPGPADGGRSHSRDGTRRSPHSGTPRATPPVLGSAPPRLGQRQRQQPAQLAEQRSATGPPAHTPQTLPYTPPPNRLPGEPSAPPPPHPYIHTYRHHYTPNFDLH